LKWVIWCCCCTAVLIVINRKLSIKTELLNHITWCKGVLRSLPGTVRASVYISVQFTTGNER
jgi:hypothetical protein